MHTHSHTHSHSHSLTHTHSHSLTHTYTHTLTHTHTHTHTRTHTRSHTHTLSLSLTPPGGAFPVLGPRLAHALPCSRTCFPVCSCSLLGACGLVSIPFSRLSAGGFLGFSLVNRCVSGLFWLGFCFLFGVPRPFLFGLCL